MFDKFFKIVMMVLTILIVFLLWTGLDVDPETYDDGNIVTIDYECDKLNEYEKVPDEVKDECKNRKPE